MLLEIVVALLKQQISDRPYSIRSSDFAAEQRRKEETTGCFYVVGTAPGTSAAVLSVVGFEGETNVDL